MTEEQVQKIVDEISKTLEWEYLKESLEKNTFKTFKRYFIGKLELAVKKAFEEKDKEYHDGKYCQCSICEKTLTQKIIGEVEKIIENWSKRELFSNIPELQDEIKQFRTRLGSEKVK